MFFSNILEISGNLFGARDMKGRLPFLYRSTDMDGTALKKILKKKLVSPGGTPSINAAKRLILGIKNGKRTALIFKRYNSY